MRRITRIALTGFVAVLSSAPVEAQQQGQGPQGQAQKAPAAQGAGTQEGGYNRGIGRTPWFNNLEIRHQFKLTDEQYNQLNKGYAESYGQYQQGMQNLGKDLTAEQRAQKMGEMHQGFNKTFSTTANEVFTDPQQRSRYDQLYLQYQGYNAFADPTVQQKLNLTSEQRQQIGQYGQEWHQQMDDLGRTYQTDREDTTTKYNEMRKQSGERMNTVLTPEQRTSWQQMTGETYNFQPNSYFQANVRLGTTNEGR